MLFYTINPNVFRENEFLRFLNRKVPTVTPIEMKQEQVCSNPKGGKLRGRDEDSTIVPARPSAELDWPSSADGHPAKQLRSSCRSSSAIRRTGLVHLGHPTSWSCVRSNSSICRTGLVQLGGWPSWSRVRSSLSIRRTGQV